MSNRSAMLFVMAATLALVACSGPSKRGIEARSEAQNRLNLVNAQVHIDQARRSFEVGQFDKALKEINQAIARFDEHPDSHILRGRIFLETHRLENAIMSFQRAIELDEHNARAHYFAGIVYQRWSNQERAYKHYMQALEADSSNVQYLLAAAESLIAMDDPDGAEEIVVPSLSYFEHNAALRHLLGHVELLRDNPEAAVQHLSEARMLNPDDDLLLEELAWAKYAAGRYARSYEVLRDLMSQQDEPRFDLKLTKARCLSFMGRHREARSLYLTLSRNYSNEAVVWIELGALAWEIRDYQRVNIAGTRAISLAPDRYEGYLLRSLYAKEQGDADEAMKLVRQAAEHAPDNALPHLLLGRTLEDEGQFDAALNAYGQALRIDPENDQARKMFTRLSERTQLTNVPIN